MIYFRPSNFLRFSLLALGAALTVTLTGCGMGTMATPNGTDAIAAPITGIIHGGPNPVVGAQVILYTTGSSYGGGNVLQEATAVNGTHQDTTSTGSFSFAGGYTCPANSYAYVVAYGGNSGSGTNPNSVLMAALGPCSNLTSSTYIWIDELTTVAAGYALSNFINISYSAGTTTTGYVVGVGADAGNSATSGCVLNSYYSSCTATAAAGMAHAFAMAGNLVSTTTGQAVNTTSNGAVVPAQLINTLGNILQACVNSTGGGTNTTTGAPTTTTTASGTSNDGTICGMLSAYTSYTTTGTASGTLVAAGTTLGYIQNLAKHPSGSPTLFNSSCGSNATGSTTAATCIFNLAPPTSFYTTSMTSAPPDWMMAIQYPKGSFNSTAATCGSTAISTLGTFYPFSLATDINDDIVILNEDSSTGNCYNLITIGFDGTPLGANTFDSSVALPLNVAYDAFGHAIVPAKSAAATNPTNGIIVYAAGTGDSNIPKVATVTATSSGVAADASPEYVAVDQNDNIFFTARPSTPVNSNGEITPAKPESHSAPTYTAGTSYGGTSSMNQLYLDDNGVDFALTSSSSGTGHVYGIALADSTFQQTASNSFSGGTTSHAAVATDTSGNVYLGLDNETSSTAVSPTVVLKIPYTATASAVTFGSIPTVASPTATYPTFTVAPTNGVMDGNNVLWFAEFSNPSISGATVTPGHISGYDTVNNYAYPTLFGCEFLNATATVCGSTNTTTGSAAPYVAYTTRWVAVDSSGNLWLANGSQGDVNEVIGLAAPTWPLFIHNGSSAKP